MDLTSLGTGYASEIAESALTNAKNSGLTNRDLSNANDEELVDACKQFEEYFVEQIFKTAWKSTTALTENEKDTSAYMNTMKDYYQDQYSREIATKATETGQIGLARELFEQMKRSQGVTLEEALARTAEKEKGTAEEDDAGTVQNTADPA